MSKKEQIPGICEYMLEIFPLVGLVLTFYFEIKIEVIINPMRNTQKLCCCTSCD